jgi:hypothetical protein
MRAPQTGQKISPVNRYSRVAGRPRRVFVPPGTGQPRPAFSATTLRNHAGREALFRSRRGDPHGVVLARPA